MERGEGRGIGDSKCSRNTIHGQALSYAGSNTQRTSKTLSCAKRSAALEFPKVSKPSACCSDNKNRGPIVLVTKRASECRINRTQHETFEIPSVVIYSHKINKASSCSKRNIENPGIRVSPTHTAQMDKKSKVNCIRHGTNKQLPS